jgi:hypothetical protein
MKDQMGQLLDRRNFLKDAGVFAVSAAILGSSASARAASWEVSSARITAVLYDERYSDCRSFAEAFVRRGATAFNTRDDRISSYRNPAEQSSISSSYTKARTIAAPRML